MIKYYDETDKIEIKEEQLKGYFKDWKYPLTPKEHIATLKGSTYFIVAIDNETNNIVGFVTALSDRINSGFIPLLEVLPQYQGKGIGTKLMEKILLKLKSIPNVDLTCDPELQPFYERFKMQKSHRVRLHGKRASGRRFLFCGS